MFYIFPWHCKWMNTSFTFSIEIYHYIVAIFVSTRLLSCLPRLFNLASTFLIKTFCTHVSLPVSTMTKHSMLNKIWHEIKLMHSKRLKWRLSHCGLKFHIFFSLSDALQLDATRYVFLISDRFNIFETRWCSKYMIYCMLTWSCHPYT